MQHYLFNKFLQQWSTACKLPTATTVDSIYRVVKAVHKHKTAIMEVALKEIEQNIPKGCKDAVFYNIIQQIAYWA